MADRGLRSFKNPSFKSFISLALIQKSIISIFKSYVIICLKLKLKLKLKGESLSPERFSFFIDCWIKIQSSCWTSPCFNDPSVSTRFFVLQEKQREEKKKKKTVLVWWSHIENIFQECIKKGKQDSSFIVHNSSCKQREMVMYCLPQQ